MSLWKKNIPNIVSNEYSPAILEVNTIQHSNSIEDSDSSTTNMHQVSFTRPHVCTSKDKRSKYICPGTLNFQDLFPLSVSDNRAPAVPSATTPFQRQREYETQRERLTGSPSTPPPPQQSWPS